MSARIASTVVRMRASSSATAAASRPRFSQRAITVLLEIHPVAALELQDLAGLVRGRDLEAEALDDLARLHDLLGVRFRELAGPDLERVLETDAHVAAHRGRHGGDRQLVAAGAEYGPVVLVAEQPVGGALHVRHVLRVRADAAENPE